MRQFHISKLRSRTKSVAGGCRRQASWIKPKEKQWKNIWNSSETHGKRIGKRIGTSFQKSLEKNIGNLLGHHRNNIGKSLETH